MFTETWVAFAIASSILLLIPGPTVMVVISFALANGKASSWATVPGAVLGDFTAMTISLLGAGAILAASATLFTALKLVGALYLIWLGFQLWRAEPEEKKSVGQSRTTTRRRMFWNTCLVTALNPKSIVFFIAFVPQFINPEAQLLYQFVVLEVTFLVLAAMSLIVWAALAGQARAGFQQPAALRVINRIGGSFLMAAGLVTATANRAN